MNDKELTPEQSIQLIERMMKNSQQHIAENGFHFLLWGFLILIVSITQYFLIQQGAGKEVNWLWVGMSVIGGVLAIVYERFRKDREQQPRNQTMRIYGKIWLGFGISLGLIIYMTLKSGVNPIPFILLIVGLAMFISSAVYRLKILLYGAVVFWLGAFISLQLEKDQLLLVNAVAITLGYIVPGSILYSRSKKKYV